MGGPDNGLSDSILFGLSGRGLDGRNREYHPNMEGVGTGDAGISGLLHGGIPLAAHVLQHHPILHLCGLATGGICQWHRSGSVVSDAVGAGGHGLESGAEQSGLGDCVHHRYPADVDGACGGEVHL